MKNKGDPCGSEWPAKHIELLRSEHAKGSSAVQIAAALARAFRAGYTRNAVCGKVHRLRLGGVVKPRMPRKKRHQPYKPRPKVEKPAGVVLLQSPEYPHLRCVEIEPLNLDLLDLNSNDCRYPYGDAAPFRFCGHPAIEGKAYCLSHLALCTGMGTSSERSAARI
jgi:GcrA cell cycle regulator